MSKALYIESYTDKSFVVRGTETKTHKDNLKLLGGKWNSSLTDKSNGEKFGAWIYPITLKAKVQEFIKNPSTTVIEPQTFTFSKEQVSREQVSREQSSSLPVQKESSFKDSLEYKKMLKRINDLENRLNALEGIEESENEEEDYVPEKSFLRK